MPLALFLKLGDRVSIRENATSIRTGRVTDIIRRVDQTTVKERVMLSYEVSYPVETAGKVATRIRTRGGCWEPNTPEPPPTVQADHFLLSTTPQYAPAWQALKSKHDSTDLVLEVETTDYLEEHYNYVYDPESREGKVLKSLVLAPGQVLAVVHIKNLTGLQTKQVARVVRDCAFIEGGDIPVQGALHLKDCVPMERGCYLTDVVVALGRSRIQREKVRDAPKNKRKAKAMLDATGKTASARSLAQRNESKAADRQALIEDTGRARTDAQIAADNEYARRGREKLTEDGRLQRNARQGQYSRSRQDRDMEQGINNLIENGEGSAAAELRAAAEDVKQERRPYIPRRAQKPRRPRKSDDDEGDDGRDLQRRKFDVGGDGDEELEGEEEK